MNDPLQALLALGAKSDRFPPNSRYSGAEVAEWTAPDGSVVAYLRRRFCPAPDRLAAFAEHTVEATDRLDNLAARYLGDPELFWRLCDGNAAMRPDDLTAEAGRVLRVTLPEGLPGTANA